MKRAAFVLGLAALGGYLYVAPAALAKDDNKKDAEKALPDNDFLVKAATGNAMEITLGAIALRQGASESVRQFGQRLLTDHRSANQTLGLIAREQKITLPQQVSQEDLKVVDKFSRLKGNDFDRQFIDQMVADHEKDVSLYEAQAKETKDRHLKKYIDKTLPVIKRHLKIARKLQAKAEKR